MPGFFHNLGRRLGHTAIPGLRKTKWIWQGLTGSEEEALQAEVAFGRVLAVELRQTTEPLNDAGATELLDELCRRLSERLRDRRRTFRAEAFLDEAPNAMALPGGFIFISHTLLDFCRRDPDELAFILGHEMAHVIREHVWDRMLNQTASRATSIIAARAGPLGTWLRQKGLTLLQSAHARDLELEADEFGLRLLVAAHFKSAGAEAFFRRLEQLEPSGTDLGQYFSSHPPATERLAHLKSKLKVRRTH